MRSRRWMAAALFWGCTAMARAEGGYLGASLGIMDADRGGFDEATNAGVLGGYGLYTKDIFTVALEVELTTTIADGATIVRLEFLVFAEGAGAIEFEGQNLGGGDASALLDANGDPIARPYEDGELSLEQKAKRRASRRSSTQAVADRSRAQTAGG